MNITTPIRTLAAATVLAATASLASAAILELGATADGYIRASQNAGQTNNATNHIFLVGHTSATDDLRGVLSFNLNDPLLAGATINSVTLTLFIESTDANSQPGDETIQLFSLTESFAESTVTWTSRDGTTDWTTEGGTTGSLLATTTADADTVAPGDSLIFSSGDLATAVSSSIGGSFDLLVALANPDASRDIFRIASRTPLGNGNPALVPSLTIDYTAATIPEPSTAAALAGLGILGFATLKRRARR